VVTKRFRSDHRRARRRAYAIRGYVGANGHGKTLAAVWDLLPSLELGRPVLSTARILDYGNPRDCEDEGCVWPGHPEHGAAHPLWVPFLGWEQFLSFEDGDIFMDEVAGVASSRESGALPFQVARELQKLRKRGVALSYTAPAFGRTDKIVRECTQLLTHCQGAMAVQRSDAVKGTVWRDRRFFTWKSYDAQEFDAFTSAKARATEGEGDRPRIKPLFVDRFWRPGSPAESAYDSYDAVLSLGWANDAGYCMTCGGRRRIPQCKCSDQAREDSAVARFQRAARAEPEDPQECASHDVPVLVDDLAGESDPSSPVGDTPL
jgi:hypothetical protein